MPIKVKMIVSKYVDDAIELDLEFKTFKSFKRFCKKLNNRLNSRDRKFVSLGNSEEAFTLRIGDIESISYEIL